ncbi:acetyl esterase domain protein, partial [Bacteroides fragilis str. S6L3]
MKRRNLFLACLLLFVLPLSAARVDTLMVKSPSMNKEVQVLVVTPDVALGKNAAACP